MLPLGHPTLASWSEHVNELAFNGQSIVSCRSRVASQVVKGLEGLNYFICCTLTQFTNQDFCLIVGLRFDEPHDVYVEPEGISLVKAAHKAPEDP